MADPVRIGAVSYLNTRPLVHGLERDREAGGFELSYSPPAELADRMIATHPDQPIGRELKAYLEQPRR